MRDKNLLGFYSFAFVFLLATFSIGTWIERDQSSALLLAFSVFSVSYLFLLQQKDATSVLLAIGILARLLLFISLPSLSDDIYRFIWDGTLLKNGIHPFAQLPDYYVDKDVAGLDRPLFEQLNSPSYFTIYPPINQAIFWLSVTIGGSWLASANVIRVILLAADIGSLFLLQRILDHLRKDKQLAFWYFLNPLVILELTGNLHFEGLVIFFLLLGIYCLSIKSYWLSAAGFGLAIGTKLLPLIYLPFLFFQGLREKRWWMPIAAGVIAVLTLLPLFDETFINGMASSLDLYFRKFEFNASIYFIAREIGFWIYGYNNIAKIGPLLSVFSLISILGISIVGWLKKWSPQKAFLFVLTLYLLFATIVHPWYVIPLIAFGILAGYRFPVLWSFMIFLTYLGYTKTGFELPLWIVTLEYFSIAIFAIFEFSKPRHK